MSDEGNEAEVNSATVGLCGGKEIPDQVNNPTKVLETDNKVPEITSPVVIGSENNVGEMLACQNEEAILRMQGTQGSANLQNGRGVGRIKTLQGECPLTPQGGDNVGTLRAYNRSDEAETSSDDQEELDLIVDISSQQTSAGSDHIRMMMQDHHRRQTLVPPNTNESNLIQFGSFEFALSSSSALIQPVQSRFASTSLYIADLNVNASKAYLVELFSLVGEVEAVSICHDASTGRPTGRGYVKFRTVEQATNALATLNYTSINGEQMRLMYSMFNSPARHCNEKANVFVKNLDASIDTQALHDTFSAFGFVLSCKVAVDESGRSKGHGFVQFEDEDSARTAIEKVNGMLMENRKVSVLPFVPRTPQMVVADHEFTNVYVKNFTINTSEEDLMAVFGKFGAIKSAVVMRDSQGVSKCFGFVDFEDHKAAAEAIFTLDGKTNAIDGRQWYVGRAQKREERLNLLLAKFHQDQETQQSMRNALEDDHRWSTASRVDDINQQQARDHRVFTYFGDIPFYGLHLINNNINNNTDMSSGDVPKKKSKRRRGKRSGGRKSKHSQENHIDELAPAVLKGDEQHDAATSSHVTPIKNLQEHEAVAAVSPSQLSSDYVGVGADPSHGHEDGGSDDAILTSALISAVAADKRLAMLGGSLYPLLEQFEQEHSTEVSLYVLVRVETNDMSHLTASPTALQAKVDSSKQLVMIVPQVGAREEPAPDVVPVPGLMTLQMMA